jgi:hypothetical protein
MAVETTRSAHWSAGLTRPVSVRVKPRLALLAGAITNKSALGAKLTEEATSIRRFAFGVLLTFAWLGFLVWFAASAVVAVM